MKAVIYPRPHQPTRNIASEKQRLARDLTEPFSSRAAVLLSPAAREALAKPSLRRCAAPAHGSLRRAVHFRPNPLKVCITSPPTFQQKITFHQGIHSDIGPTRCWF